MHSHKTKKANLCYGKENQQVSAGRKNNLALKSKVQKNNKGNSNAPQDAIKEYTANILIVDFIDCIYVKNPSALSIISKKIL